jgi:hypothetical protein
MPSRAEQSRAEQKGERDSTSGLSARRGRTLSAVCPPPWCIAVSALRCRVAHRVPLLSSLCFRSALLCSARVPIAVVTGTATRDTT